MGSEPLMSHAAVLIELASFRSARPQCSRTGAYSGPPGCALYCFAVFFLLCLAWRGFSGGVVGASFPSLSPMFTCEDVRKHMDSCGVIRDFYVKPGPPSIDIDIFMSCP